MPAGLRQSLQLGLDGMCMLVDRVMKGRPNRQVAMQFGVSVKSVDKSLRRYRAEGRQGRR